MLLLLFPPSPAVATAAGGGARHARGTRVHDTQRLLFVLILARLGSAALRGAPAGDAWRKAVAAPRAHGRAWPHASLRGRTGPQKGEDSAERERRSGAAPAVAGALYAAQNPPNRFDHAMAGLGESIYLFGGQRGEVKLNVGLWKFDAALETPEWVQEPGLPDGVRLERSQHMLISQLRADASGRILLLGGSAGTKTDELRKGCSFDPQCCSNPSRKDEFTDVWSYNVSTRKWTEHHLNPEWGCSCIIESSPCPRTGPAFQHARFVGVGIDQVLSFGGFDTKSVSNVDETWVLDTNAWAWKDLFLGEGSEQIKPPPRRLHGMAWVNSTATARKEPRGVVVVFGGYGGDSNSDIHLGDTWLLSLTQKKWKLVSSAQRPAPRKNHNMASHDRWVYMHGGDTHNGGLNDVWRFDAESSVWREMNSPSAALVNRHKFAMAASSSGMIFFHGGKLGTDEMSPNNFNNDKMHFIDTTRLCDALSYYSVSQEGGDGRCESCSECPPDHYLVLGCSAEKDTECQPCSVCEQDDFVWEECTAQRDTICRKCDTLDCRPEDIAGGAGDETEAGLGNGLIITALFREGCGSGSTGTCRQCTSCGATEYLDKSCSTFSDTVCAKCSDLDQECGIILSSLANSSSGTTSFSQMNCGNGNRGECVAVAVGEPAAKREPLWLIVLLVALILVLICIMCALAVHMKRWLQKKKKQTEQSRVKRFEVLSTDELQTGNCKLKSPPSGAVQIQDSTDRPGGPSASDRTDTDDLVQNRNHAGCTAAGVGDLQILRQERSPDAGGTGLSGNNSRARSVRRPPTAHKPPGAIVTSPTTPDAAPSPRSGESKDEIILLQSAGRPGSATAATRVGQQGRPRRKVMLSASSNKRLETVFDSQTASAVDCGEGAAHGAGRDAACKQGEENREAKAPAHKIDDEFAFAVEEASQRGIEECPTEAVEISSAPAFPSMEAADGEIGGGEAAARIVPTNPSPDNSPPTPPCSSLYSGLKSSSPVKFSPKASPARLSPAVAEVRSFSRGLGAIWG